MDEQESDQTQGSIVCFISWPDAINLVFGIPCSSTGVRELDCDFRAEVGEDKAIALVPELDMSMSHSVPVFHTPVRSGSVSS